jgi:hypothetical protein
VPSDSNDKWEEIGLKLEDEWEGVDIDQVLQKGPSPQGDSLCAIEAYIGVQVDYNVVHLRTSLVQLFVLLLRNFEKVVQMIELKRFGGAPNGYPFAPLIGSP